MNYFSHKLMTAYRAKMYPNYWDILAFLFVFSIISLFAWNAEQMVKPYQIGQSIPISLDPAFLPFYASRTVMRMLIALVCSFLFTFIFGTLAAKNKRAERIIIPIIDILQSVPILGFLSITVTGFIALFPNSILGPECAAVFVIFTSQAWNMAFSFYQGVRTVPAELEEASRMFHLSAWQRFWKIDVPFAIPGLLWNTMMSMSGGWFFVVASEAITVSNQNILLPGIGSYIATAVKAADIHAICYAILAMFIVIVIYDQLMFRPLVAWADKFKYEKQASATTSESWLINLFQRTRFIKATSIIVNWLSDAFVNIKIFREPLTPRLNKERVTHSDKWLNIIWNTLMLTTCIVIIVIISKYAIRHFTLSEIRHVFWLGILTWLRVFTLVILCSFIWVPIGVWVGLKPRVAQIGQPLAQFLAAFPANLLYPFFVMFIVNYELNPNIWLTPLMILGAQWYILFNVIAGASTIPKDLLEMTDNFNVSGWLRWKNLILPAISPYYITGALTAAGGAWNASIVAEVASWGKITLIAEGLGSYITRYTTLGDFSRITLGIGVMCILILIFSRLVWRPLYAYAINHYTFD